MVLVGQKSPLAESLRSPIRRRRLGRAWPVYVGAQPIERGCGPDECRFKHASGIGSVRLVRAAVGSNPSGRAPTHVGQMVEGAFAPALPRIVPKTSAG